jgi:hypothetical protein
MAQSGLPLVLSASRERTDMTRRDAISAYDPKGTFVPVEPGLRPLLTNRD